MEGAGRPQDGRFVVLDEFGHLGVDGRLVAGGFERAAGASGRRRARGVDPRGRGEGEAAVAFEVLGVGFEQPGQGFQGVRRPGLGVEPGQVVGQDGGVDGDDAAAVAVPPGLGPGPEADILEALGLPALGVGGPAEGRAVGAAQRFD